MLYGTHGIGKSTFGACAPSPIFIRTEDGLQDIDTSAFPLATHISDVFQAVQELRSQPHDFKTLVLDSADWTEKLIHKQVCEQHGKDAITDISFGKGYGSAATMFGLLLEELGKLSTQCGMLTIFLAHCQIEKFENPQTESYDRYTPKLHKSINGTIQEWCDEVLFCSYKVYTKETEEGFNKTRNRAIGGGERVIYSTEKPSHLAKNRITGMPEEFPLSFVNYWQYVEASGGDVVKATPQPVNASPNLAEQAEKVF